MDEEQLLDILKDNSAYNTTDTATLVPAIIDPGIRMFVETRSPLWAIMNRFPWETMVYSYREQNTLPSASFRAELEALPDAVRAAYTQRNFDMKSVYVRGEISGQIQAASRTLVNIVQRETSNLGTAMVRTLEQKLISGNASSDPDEFNGLAIQVTNNVFGDTNNNGTGTDQPLTIAKLDELLDAPPGSAPNVLIFSLPMRRKLWSMLQPQLRYYDTVVDGAFRVPTYNGIPILEIRDSQTFLDTGVLAIDTQYAYVPILQDMSYEELAHTRDSLDFMIKMYCTLVVEGPARYHAKLTDVTSTLT